jgi:hypothetical protein
LRSGIDIVEKLLQRARAYIELRKRPASPSLPPGVMPACKPRSATQVRQKGFEAVAQLY